LRKKRDLDLKMQIEKGEEAQRRLVSTRVRECDCCFGCLHVFLIEIDLDWLKLHMSMIEMI
jgi:hypothetical protein